MKNLYQLIIILNLSACSQQEFTDDELLVTSVNFLKSMCESRQVCIDQIDLAAVDCKSQEASEFFSSTADIDPQIKSGAEFQFCITQQMDDTFMAKFNQVFPVTEVDGKSSSSSHPAQDFLNTSNNQSYGFLNDSKVLQIKESGGQFEILNQSLHANKIKAFILKNDLTSQYDSVVLIVNDDLPVNTLLQAKNEVEKAGFKKASLARKEKMNGAN